MLTFFLFCLLAGCAAGFLSGLFGIGGGMVIVPMMVYLLPIVGVPDSLLMSTALGTSFATIVITAFSSAQRHHKLGNVVWSTLKYFAPALMLSAFISGQYISKLPPEISGKLFACLVTYLAIKMILSIKPKNLDPNKKITPLSSIIGGALIGMISSVAGIGGGGFIVPFLNSRNVDIKKSHRHLRILWHVDGYRRHVKLYAERLGNTGYAKLFHWVCVPSCRIRHYHHLIFYLQTRRQYDQSITGADLEERICRLLNCGGN